MRDEVPTEANESVTTVMLFIADNEITINAITGQFNLL